MIDSDEAKTGGTSTESSAATEAASTSASEFVNELIAENGDTSSSGLSQGMKKIEASLETQLSLARLSFALLGKISEQTSRPVEELLTRVQRSIFLELILLHDNVENAVRWARGLADPSKEEICNRLETLEIELIEILLRKDVRPFEEHPASLDAKLHRTVKIVATTDLKADQTIAEILRTGFFWGEKVLRPEEVIVRKFASCESAKGD